jgi:pyrroline-5-carboxylate reductase
LNEIHTLVGNQHLLISIAAGFSLKKLQEGLGKDCRIIRVMPNTPCLVGAGATGFSPGEKASEEDMKWVDQLFNAVGRVFQLPEKHLDAVTGLSGSGPAYVALMIEALTDGGVLMGLPRDVALVLAEQTVLGSAKLLLETGLHPTQMKDMVASPAGTTMAGLQILEQSGFRAALMNCVAAATKRSIELGI